MAELTWRNVDAPSSAEALTGLELSNRLFNKALASGQSGIDQIQQMQRDAADRAIALRANEIQDPALYRQAVMDRSLLGLDAQNASLSTIQNLGNGVNTLAARDTARVNAADLLHTSANNLRNEQDKKWVFSNFNAIKNSSATFGEAITKYNQLAPSATEEQRAALLAQIEQTYGGRFGGPVVAGASPVGGITGVGSTAAGVPSGSGMVAPDGTPIPASAAVTDRLTAAVAGSPAAPGTVDSTLLTPQGALAEEATLRANQDMAAATFDYPALMQDQRDFSEIKKTIDPTSPWAGADPQQLEGNFANVKERIIKEGKISEPTDALVFSVMNESLEVGGFGRDLVESFAQVGNETDPAFKGWYLNPDTVGTNIAKLKDNTSRNKQATAKETLAQVDLLNKAVVQQQSAANEVLQLRERVQLNPEMAPSLAAAEQRLLVRNEAVANLTTQLKDRENTQTTEAAARTAAEKLKDSVLGLGKEADNYSAEFNKKWLETASPSGRKRVFGYKREIKDGQLIETGTVLTGGGRNEVITTTSRAPKEITTPRVKVDAALKTALTPQQKTAADNDPARRLLKRALDQPKPPQEDQRQVWTKDDLDSIIQDEAQQAGLPKEVVDKFVKIESSYDPYAVSKAGAMGLFQLLPSGAIGEGKRLGVIDDSFDPYNPQQNAKLAFWYINLLSKQYNGDMRKTVAAYNTGPGNLETAMKKAKTSGKSWEEYVHSDTKDYLKKFFG